jgi:hypothetical protein
MQPSVSWRFLVVGYGLSVLIETPVLLVGLSQRHPLLRRAMAGLWLTACSYPIIALVLPYLIGPQWVFVLVSEVFATLYEWGLFCLAFPAPPTGFCRDGIRDGLAIVVANLASLGIGEVLHAAGVFERLA